METKEEKDYKELIDNYIKQSDEFFEEIGDKVSKHIINKSKNILTGILKELEKYEK